MGMGTRAISIKKGFSPTRRGAIFLFALTLAVYWWTAFPTITSGDSAEIAIAALNFGIPHAPGFPLYMFFGGLFSLLPFGEPAFRVAVVSMLAGSGAAAFIYLTAKNRTGNSVVSFAAAGLFAFSPVVWAYATRPEVFSLNNLLCAILLYLFERYLRLGRDRDALLGALVTGLGMCNQQLLGVFVVPMLGLLALQAVRKPSFRWLLLKMSGVFVLGLLPYFYLSVLAFFEPVMAWGNTGTLAGLLFHMLRKDFGTFTLSVNPGPADPGMRLKMFGEACGAAFLYIGLSFVLIGTLAARFRRQVNFEALLVLCILLYVGFFSLLADHNFQDRVSFPIEERFWQQPLIPLFLLFAQGAAWAIAQARLKKLPIQMLAGALPLVPLVLNWSDCNQHSNTVFRDYGIAVLDSVEKNSLLISKSEVPGDAIQYAQLALHLRPDVRFVPMFVFANSWGEPWLRRVYPELNNPGRGSAEFLQANAGRYPTYVTGPLRPDQIQRLGAAFSIIPFAFCERVLPLAQVKDLDWHRWRRDGEAAFSHFDVKRLRVRPLRIWEWWMLDTITVAQRRWSRLIAERNL